MLQFEKHIAQIRENDIKPQHEVTLTPDLKRLCKSPCHHPFPLHSGRLNIPFSSQSLIQSFHCIHSSPIVWGLLPGAGVIARTSIRQMRRPVIAYKETGIHKQAIPKRWETLDLRIQKAQSHHSNPRSKRKSNSEISLGKCDCFDWFGWHVTTKFRIWSLIFYTLHPRPPQTRIKWIPISWTCYED